MHAHFLLGGVDFESLSKAIAALRGRKIWFSAQELRQKIYEILLEFLYSENLKEGHSIVIDEKYCGHLKLEKKNNQISINMNMLHQSLNLGKPE